MRTFTDAVPGEWFATGRSLTFKCCTCGLVHTFRFRLGPGLEFQMSINPDEETGCGLTCKATPLVAVDTLPKS